ncbi:hypothetical protein GCM10027360_66980 [Amycolatopsis echigonensis]
MRKFVERSTGTISRQVRTGLMIAFSACAKVLPWAAASAAVRQRTSPKLGSRVIVVRIRTFAVAPRLSVPQSPAVKLHLNPGRFVLGPSHGEHELAPTDAVSLHRGRLAV